jgi:hypothetical protein
MKFQNSFQFLLAAILAVAAFACASVNPAKNQATNADRNQTRPIPDELKKTEIYGQFVGKKEITAFKVVALPKTDFLLVYVAIPRDDATGSDPAELNIAKIFIFDNKSKKADVAKTEKINRDLQSGSDEAKDCGGLASLDLNSFVANQGFVHLDQFFAPGMERTTCISKIFWDEKKKEIIVQRVETVTE